MNEYERGREEAFLPHTKNKMFCLDKIELQESLKARLGCQNVREQPINCLKI